MSGSDSRSRSILVICEAAQAIGYAQGVLMGLADLSKLDDRQKNCVDDAITGLKGIDLVELAKGERDG